MTCTLLLTVPPLKIYYLQPFSVLSLPSLAFVNPLPFIVDVKSELVSVITSVVSFRDVRVFSREKTNRFKDVQ